MLTCVALSFAVEVGQDEDALTPVRRSGVVSTHNDREDFVTRALQFFHDPLKAVRLEANDSKRVLCHDPSRSALAAETEKLAP